jgi:dTDP-glucose pyrophosphorylase
MKPTLLVLAAGMGSRYGGLKQLDPMGPNGETILDYSIRDAHTAGFKKVVFVIRKDFEDAFRTSVGDKCQDRIEVHYTFQQLDDLPAGFTVPAGRTKPWGTTHAIRAARDLISDPFAVINADDFYGADAYIRAIGFLQSLADDSLSSAMVGYPIRNTLSPHGTVNRGICELTENYLQSVEEVTGIREESDGSIRGDDLTGEKVTIPEDALVSMNLWGFSTAYMQAQEAHFIEFLKAHAAEAKSECYIPTVVDDLISSKTMKCEVLPTTGQWFGVTYPDDKKEVCRQLALLEK